MEKSYILNTDQLMGMKHRFEKKRNELAFTIKTGKSKYLKGDLEKLNNIKENLIRIKSALAVVNLKVNSRIYELNYTLEDISILHQYAKSKGMKSKEIQTNIEELQEKINSLKSDLNTYNSTVTSKISLIEE